MPGTPTPRLAREAETLRAMIALHCRDRHGPGQGLCDACADLQTYALRRLDACRYAGAKPACSNCPSHCYAPARRQAIREIMAYAGPRMLRHHPVMALRHLADKLRPTPPS